MPVISTLWRRGALAIAVCAALLVVAAPAGAWAGTRADTGFRAAGPAIWKLEHRGGTMYLFGTFHALRPGTAFFTRKIIDSFEESDMLVLEVEIDRVDQQYANSLFARYGIFPEGQQLTDAMSPEDIEALANACAMFGIPISGLQRFRPWLVSLMISSLVSERIGFRGSAGADFQLLQRARISGKFVTGAETVDEQIMALSGMSDETQYAWLNQTTYGIGEAAEEMEAMIRMWLAGDTKGIERSIEETMEEVPGLYEALLIGRNENWVPRFEAMIQPGQTVFVAVGAAHLVGPHSVIRKLRNRGYRIRRLR